MTKLATCWMVHWASDSARCSVTPGNSLACSSQQKGRSVGIAGCGGGDDIPAGIKTLWCMLRRRLIARSAAAACYTFTQSQLKQTDPSRGHAHGNSSTSQLRRRWTTSQHCYLHHLHTEVVTWNTCMWQICYNQHVIKVTTLQCK